MFALSVSAMTAGGFVFFANMFSGIPRWRLRFWIVTVR